MGCLFILCVLCCHLPVAFMPVLASTYTSLQHSGGVLSEKIAPKVFIIDMVRDI